MRELPYQSWEHLLSEYRAALDQLREWNVRVPGGCRLRKYEEALKAFADQPPISPEDLASAGYLSMIVFRECDEIIEIVDSFPNGPADSARLRLNKLCQGRVHPDEEEKHSPARDAQFELHLRAVLMRGDLPAALGTPDVQPRIGGERLPIEAKRLKSPWQFEKHVYRAAEQIQKSSHAGVIAFSLNRVLRPSKSQMKARSGSRIRARLREKAQTFADRRKDKILRHTNERDVLAVLYVLRMPARVGGDFPFGLFTHHLLDVIECPEENRARLDRLVEALERGGS